MPLAVEDDLAIRNLIARYNHAIDFGTPEEYAECFTPDGEFDARPVIHCHNRDDLADFARRVQVGDRLGRHWTSNVFVDGAGDEAVSRVYLLNLTAGKQAVIGPTGCYHDKLVKRDGQWYFSYRKLHFEDPPTWDG